MQNNKTTQTYSIDEDCTIMNNIVQCITKIFTPSNETNEYLIESVKLWGDVENRRNIVISLTR